MGLSDACGMHPPRPRHCKILCTLGPASASEEVIGQLIDAGMNAVRLNFSHGSHEDHRRVFRTVRQQASLRDVAIAILADLQGPKLRVGEMPADGLELVEGSKVIISTDPEAKVGQSDGVTLVTTNYPPMAAELDDGDTILLDDGHLELQVKSCKDGEVHAEVVVGGTLTSNKGINLPGVALKIPALTQKDKTDLRFALELGVDAVALSFVRRPEDLDEARDIMIEMDQRKPLIAKIEKPQAIENLSAIVDAAEGIMVARGDLGVEMGPERVPIIQKRAIEMANARGKLVVTATQMLDSMIRQPRPTRAEASDVANAVLDGSDTLMLSGETAVGRFPVRSVQTMDRIIRSTESAPRAWERPMDDLALGHTTNAIAKAAVSAARSWSGTKAILCYTGTGGIARLVSEYRPRLPIYAFTPNAGTYQSLALYWGVTPMMFSPSSPDGETIFIDLDKLIRGRGVLQAGDRIVVTFSHPIKAGGSTNLLKLHTVGESLAQLA